MYKDVLPKRCEIAITDYIYIYNEILFNNFNIFRGTGSC